VSGPGGDVPRGGAALPARIVVAGPSGAGKTTVGLALAAATGRPFLDADDLHPARNRALMAAGTPLTDEDRWPWLDAVREAMAARPACVMACSALRRVYRDRLAGGGTDAAPDADLDVAFVLLAVHADELERRVARRPGHFMPASLVASQVATLEPPELGERVLVVDSTLPVDEVVATVLACLAVRADGPGHHESDI
jgi:gluconokinase